MIPRYKGKDLEGILYSDTIVNDCKASNIVFDRFLEPQHPFLSADPSNPPALYKSSAGYLVMGRFLLNGLLPSNSIYFRLPFFLLAGNKYFFISAYSANPSNFRIKAETYLVANTCYTNQQISSGQYPIIDLGVLFFQTSGKNISLVNPGDPAPYALNPNTNNVGFLNRSTFIEANNNLEVEDLGIITQTHPNIVGQGGALPRMYRTRTSIILRGAFNVTSGSSIGFVPAFTIPFTPAYYYQVVTCYGYGGGGQPGVLAFQWYYDGSFYLCNRENFGSLNAFIIDGIVVYPGGAL
jgi:hypothetical protein